MGLCLHWPLLLRSVDSGVHRTLCLQCTDSGVVAHRLACCWVCGTFWDQGYNPWWPAWAGRFWTTEPPGKPDAQPSILCLSPRDVEESGIFASWQREERGPVDACWTFPVIGISCVFLSLSWTCGSSWCCPHHLWLPHIGRGCHRGGWPQGSLFHLT